MNLNENPEILFLNGFKCLLFSDLESTNKYALDLVKEDSNLTNVVISAQYQQNGRGQMQTKWHSPSGESLLMSYIFKPKNLKAEHQFYFNMAFCLAICEALDAFFPEEKVKIKWPNDIYIGRKKVGGVLIELNLRGQYIQNIVAGLGLNVAQSHFPDNLPHATSLKIEGASVSSLFVLEKIIGHLQVCIYKLNGGAFSWLSERYHQRLFGLKREEEFLIKEEKKKGVIQGVTPQGLLKVDHNGQLKNYGLKEIQLVL